MTPAAAVSDLVRIAIVTQDMPDMDPVRILAEDTVRELTRAEAARTMVLLATIARAFALSLPADQREALVQRMEEVLVDAALVRHEIDLLEDSVAD